MRGEVEGDVAGAGGDVVEEVGLPVVGAVVGEDEGVEVGGVGGAGGEVAVPVEGGGVAVGVVPEVFGGGRGGHFFFFFLAVGVLGGAG